MAPKKQVPPQKEPWTWYWEYCALCGIAVTARWRYCVHCGACLHWDPLGQFPNGARRATSADGNSAALNEANGRAGKGGGGWASGGGGGASSGHGGLHGRHDN